MIDKTGGPADPTWSTAAGGADVLVELEQVGRVVPVLDRDQAGIRVRRVGRLHFIRPGFGSEVDVCTASGPRVYGLVGRARPSDVLGEPFAIG